MVSLSQRTLRVAFAVLACTAAVQRPTPTPSGSSASAIKIPFETLHAAERADGHPRARSHDADRSRWTSGITSARRTRLPGRTGFAHLFEHVMFTGSGHVPYGMHDKLTEGVGGVEQRHDLERPHDVLRDGAVELPRGRSSGSSPIAWASCSTRSISPSSTRSATSCKNERRQSVDNQPYGRALRDPRAGARIRRSHPYSWQVIGSMADLSAASEEDVKNFFRLYYAPNNAILTIVGDFDPAQAKAWVTKYFGDIPRGKPDHAAERSQPVTLAKRDSGSSSRIACRCRGSTSSGRRSARRATTGSRSTCSARSSPVRARRG